MGQVTGKVAIVTGGASGIGAACARTLAREGARVVVSDIDDAMGKGVVDAVRGGDKIESVRIEGDAAPLLASQQARVDEWNAALDASGFKAR